MKKEKPQIGVRPAKPSDPKDLGVIKFGKSRPDEAKYRDWETNTTIPAVTAEIGRAHV